MKPYIIRKNNKLSNPYQLLVLEYIFKQDGTLLTNYAHIDNFKSESKAISYYNTHKNEYTKTLLFKDIYTQLLKYKQISKRTKDSLEYAYNKLPSLHNKNIYSITLPELTNIILSYNTFSIRKKLRSLLTQIYKYLISQQIEIDNLPPKISIPKISNNKSQYTTTFTLSELTTICNDYYDELTYDIFIFILHTGIKIYDTLNLKISDIDINTLSIIDSSNLVTKLIPLDTITKQILLKHYSKDKIYLFENKNKQIEYSVFRRYHWDPFMNHYNMNHTPQDIYATYQKHNKEEDYMARRREKGTGGIKFRKGRSKPYDAQVTIFEMGNPKRISIGTFETEKEALEALDRYNYENYLNDKSKYAYTFKDVYDKLIEYRILTQAAKDPDAYRFAFNAVSMLHNIRFSSLTHNDLFKAMIESKRSLPTIRTIKLLYRLMYKFAIAEKIVAHDESLAIKITENSRLFPYTIKHEHKSFTEAEIKEINSDINNPYMVDIINVLIHTGFRINEFITLTKSSVDLKKKTLRIAEEYAKTTSSIREIPIHPAIYPIIKRQYDNCKDDNSPLFPGNNKKKFNYNNFCDAYWHPFMALHNLGHHLPHDTRYTFSTFWTYCDLPTRDGEAILGHGSKNDMSKLYKTPDVSHLHHVISKLRFDLSNLSLDALNQEQNDLDDFKKMKYNMERLGFDSMTEYMEYVEFKNSKARQDKVN